MGGCCGNTHHHKNSRTVAFYNNHCYIKYDFLFKAMGRSQTTVSNNQGVEMFKYCLRWVVNWSCEIDGVDRFICFLHEQWILLPFFFWLLYDDEELAQTITEIPQLEKRVFLMYIGMTWRQRKRTLNAMSEEERLKTIGGMAVYNPYSGEERGMFIKNILHRLVIQCLDREAYNPLWSISYLPLLCLIKLGPQFVIWAQPIAERVGMAEDMNVKDRVEFMLLMSPYRRQNTLEHMSSEEIREQTIQALEKEARKQK